MLQRLFLPSILLILAWGFWVSPNFKEIAAGVAIFLFGMISLEQGFRAFTGGLLENLLRKSTDRYWKSLSFGITTTSLMQSSSLVSVITISFLSAGLISLTSGIGIIFGANIGTTTGAWLVAAFGMKVKISAYAMPMIVFGVILVFQKSKQLKGIGYILAGVGFLFLGIHYMKEGFDAYRDTIDLKAFAVSGYPGLLLFTLLGMAATVIMQSSHATLVLTITALASGQITYENGLALAIGANIGTTITAIIGSLSSNVDGRRLAGAHLIFNLVTAMLAILLIYQLVAVVDIISAWMGIDADNYTLKLAVFHTLFNFLGVLVMTPMINPMVTFLEKQIKPKIRDVAQPRYLHDSSTEFGETSLEAVRKEMLHLYDNAARIIASGIRLDPDKIGPETSIEELLHPAHLRGPIDIAEQYTENIKGLYSAIVSYISNNQAGLTPEQTEELHAMRSAGQRIIEAIKSVLHLQKNLNRYLVSPNQAIRSEYEIIRKQLATALQVLSIARTQGQDSAELLSLDALKIENAEIRRTLDSEVDRLVREHLVTANMATSLMKDSNYSYHAANKLIKAGQDLFSTSDSHIRHAERSLSLDEHEIDQSLSET